MKRQLFRTSLYFRAVNYIMHCYRQRDPKITFGRVQENKYYEWILSSRNNVVSNADVGVDELDGKVFTDGGESWI
jgi:hypothetical protein